MVKPGEQSVQRSSSQRSSPQRSSSQRSSSQRSSSQRSSSQQLNTLLQTSGLWRASGIDGEPREGLRTGFHPLDEMLPGRGWPTAGVTELLHDPFGIGELRLLLPALARLSQQRRWLMWVNPPFVPFAPALTAAGIDLRNIIIVKAHEPADMLWTMEQALASQACSAVLAWPGDIKAKHIRRLQLASKAGDCWQLLFRPLAAAEQASPAELRIRLEPGQASPLAASSAVRLRILKRRGGWASDDLVLSLPDELNLQMPHLPDLAALLPEHPVADETTQPDFFAVPRHPADSIKLQ